MSGLARATGVLMAVARGAMLVAFLAMLLLTLVQVANRFLIGAAIFWTEELIVLLLVWATLLGMPVQLWRHEEIVVDVLPAEAGAGAWIKRWVGGACSAAFLGVLLWSGVAFVERGLMATSPTMGLSRLWFFLPIPLSAALSLLALAARPVAPNAGGFE